MRLKNFNLSIGSQFFKACSDTSRIRILHLIHSNKEMCNTDLQNILEFTQSKTSRHLTYLKHAGIINSRKKNQMVIYFLKDEVFDFINQILKFLKKDTTLHNDLIIFQTMFNNRELVINNVENLEKI